MSGAEENKVSSDQIVQFESSTLHLTGLPKDYSNQERLKNKFVELGFNCENISIKETSAKLKFSSDEEGKSRLYL